MDNYTLGDGLKKLLLAGIGTVATTVDKSQEILEEMVKKGELTVDQGKALNKELKHTLKESGKTDAEGKVSAEEDLSKKIAGMSSEELADLKKKIEEAEKAASAKNDASEKAEASEN